MPHDDHAVGIGPSGAPIAQISAGSSIYSDGDETDQPSAILHHSRPRGSVETTDESNRQRASAATESQRREMAQPTKFHRSARAHGPKKFHLGVAAELRWPTNLARKSLQHW